MSLKGRIRRYRFPLAVLVIALLATALAAAQTARAIHAVDRQRFNQAVDGLQDGIVARLDTYVGMLRAGAGLAAGATFPTADEFEAFTDRLELRQRYPGVQGIGFSARITADKVQDLVDARRRAGDPEFRVWPEGPRDDYHAILYLAPLDRRNREAIGFDMSTEPTRRAAMARARDTGEPAASGSVQLVQEIDAAKQPGFLIYMPVYEGRGLPGSVEARRAQLRGFVYSPFRAGDLFAGILGRDPSPRLGFELFDGDPESGTLLYRTAAEHSDARFSLTRRFDVAGRAWTAIMFSTGGFERRSSMSIVPWVALGGAGVSVLLAFVALLQTRARERAEMFRASAERVNRLKDEFLTTLSHELRTPLNAILGWAHMLSEMELPEARRREAAGVIFRNAKVQAKLVDDLLDVSRIVSGRLRLELEPIDPEDVVRAAIDVVRPTANAKRVTLRVERDASGLVVMGDSGRLQQVIWNLLTNALKFTPAGGKVTVRLARHGDAARIMVTDTGAGIRADFLPHVFERFRQGDPRGTSEHGGLGIGLSIARSLVEMHAGAIEVHSGGENAGSTFTITLPLSETPMPDEGAA